MGNAVANKKSAELSTDVLDDILKPQVKAPRTVVKRCKSLCSVASAYEPSD